MPPEDLNAIRRLQALMDITRVVGSDESIASVLDAIAYVLTETVGFAGVVINVYRPQFDDYEAATVVGPPEMREQLLGATYDASWIHVILDERFHRRGAYFVPGARSTGSRLPSARAGCPSPSRSARSPALGAPATSCSSRAGIPTATCSR